MQARCVPGLTWAAIRLAAGEEVMVMITSASRIRGRSTASNGRPSSAATAPSFGSSDQVKNNIDNLYAYLKGRSDGAITQSRVELAK